VDRIFRYVIRFVPAGGGEPEDLDTAVSQTEAFRKLGEQEMYLGSLGRTGEVQTVDRSSRILGEQIVERRPVGQRRR
jgi:hypothetical protein